jgi:histone-lysine N-methyltransferase SETMAR
MHELAVTIGISYGVFQEILTENLNMCHIATKFVPQILTNDQKQRRVNVCIELREKANEDPTFISRIIMGDESWIYSYDPETKQQLSCEVEEPTITKSKKGSAGLEFNKEQAHCLFELNGIVHREFVPPNITVNSDVLRRLRENVQ